MELAYADAFDVTTFVLLRRLKFLLDAHDFQPGENVRRAIKEQISSASKVVIIASANSAKIRMGQLRGGNGGGT